MTLSRAIATSAVLAACLMCVPPMVADEPGGEQPTAGAVSFFRDVRPILQVHCQGCHQPAKRMGQYVLTNMEGLVKGGESETDGDSEDR